MKKLTVMLYPLAASGRWGVRIRAMKYTASGTTLAKAVHKAASMLALYSDEEVLAALEPKKRARAAVAKVVAKKVKGGVRYFPAKDTPKKKRKGGRR